MPKEKKIVIWLDDDPESVQKEILWLHALGFQVYCVATVFDLLEILRTKLASVTAIVTEFILPRVQNLEAIGKPEEDTCGGLYAGITLLDVFLRSRESPYGQIPIIILSRVWKEEIAWYHNWLREFGRNRELGPIGGLAKGESLGKFQQIFKKTAGEQLEEMASAVPEAEKSDVLIDLRGRTEEEVMNLLRNMGLDVSRSVITNLYQYHEFEPARPKEVICIWLEYIEAGMPAFVLWNAKVVTPKDYHDLHYFVFEDKRQWGMNHTSYLMK